MDDSRRVTLLVGRKSYNLRTSLDEERLREVYEVLREVISTTDPSMEQDERLFIGCITLASELVALSSHLEEIVSEGGK